MLWLMGEEGWERDHFTPINLFSYDTLCILLLLIMIVSISLFLLMWLESKRSLLKPSFIINPFLKNTIVVILIMIIL